MRRCSGKVSRYGGWAALGVSLAVYAIVILLLHQPFHVGARGLRYFDLRIYRGAAVRVAHQGAVYRLPIDRGLGFTYPPFAALLLLPLAYAPIRVDEYAVTALNVMLLVFLLRRTLLIPDRRIGGAALVAGRAQTWSLVACAAAVAIWAEPVSVTLGYGQVNLLIAALVVFDLSLPDATRSKGVAIGLAAAIKLTPLLFIPYLLLSGRRRAAVLSSAVFAGSIGLAFVAVPRDASRYWGGMFLNSSRVGNVADSADQSLRGAIARLGQGANPGVLWLLLIGAVALLGLMLAVLAARRGDEAAGFSLAALTTLLVSPISWSHHWTLAVPALGLLIRRAYQRKSRPLAAAAGVLCLIAFSYIPERTEHGYLHRGLTTLLSSDPYVLAGILVLAASTVAMSGGMVRRRQQRPSDAALTRRPEPANV